MAVFEKAVEVREPQQPLDPGAGVDHHDPASAQPGLAGQFGEHAEAAGVDLGDRAEVDSHVGAGGRLFGDAADSAFDSARRSSPPIYVAPDVEEETMTITDPLTAQVANLHGMAGDIQSA